MKRISTIISLGAEGRKCQPTVASALRAADKARGEGLDCEVLVVWEGSDRETDKALDVFRGRVRVEVAGSGKTMREGVELASGEAVAFLGVGDLMGEDWPVLAARALTRAGDRRVVIHPRLTCYFGRDLRPVCLVSPDMDQERVDAAMMRSKRLWTGFSLARRNLRLAFPMADIPLGEGVGHGDWTWNVRLAEAGIAHLTAPGTIHFVRRDENGGLDDTPRQRSAVPDWRG